MTDYNTFVYLLESIGMTDYNTVDCRVWEDKDD